MFLSALFVLKNEMLGTLGQSLISIRNSLKTVHSSGLSISSLCETEHFSLWKFSCFQEYLELVLL